MRRSWQHRAQLQVLWRFRFCFGRMRRICLRSSRHGKSTPASSRERVGTLERGFRLLFGFRPRHIPSLVMANRLKSAIMRLRARERIEANRGKRLQNLLRG